MTHLQEPIWNHHAVVEAGLAPVPVTQEHLDILDEVKNPILDLMRATRALTADLVGMTPVTAADFSVLVFVLTRAVAEPRSLLNHGIVALWGVAIDSVSDKLAAHPHVFLPLFYTCLNGLRDALAREKQRTTHENN